MLHYILEKNVTETSEYHMAFKFGVKQSSKSHRVFSEYASVRKKASPSIEAPPAV
jgi:hypothetical protein